LKIISAKTAGKGATQTGRQGSPGLLKGGRYAGTGYYSDTLHCRSADIPENAFGYHENLIRPGAKLLRLFYLMKRICHIEISSLVRDHDLPGYKAR
jgi:hypothetical protein